MKAIGSGRQIRGTLVGILALLLAGSVIAGVSAIIIYYEDVGSTLPSGYAYEHGPHNDILYLTPHLLTTTPSDSYLCIGWSDEVTISCKVVQDSGWGKTSPSGDKNDFWWNMSGFGQGTVSFTGETKIAIN